MAQQHAIGAAGGPGGDPHIRRGAGGLPLLPGGIGRSAYFTGAPTPYAMRGEGCRLWDDRGRELIDANNNFTTQIHGNAHPALIEAAIGAMHAGSCWGIPNLHEWDHAELLLARMPGLDQVRYTNSGTEAVMTAIRIARAATGREGCLLIRNGYHGSSDIALCTGAAKDRRGVPDGVARDVTLVSLNDVEALAEAVASRPDHFAAIVIDLLPNKAGLIGQSREFVSAARAIATRHGIALIIDEVISLRLGAHGLCGEYGVTPDLLTTGKLIGGGFPVGAVAGREALMRELDPARPNAIPQSGTFSGNPVSMAAGAESLRLLTPEVISRMNALGDAARAALGERVARVGWECRGRGSLLRPFSGGATGYDNDVQHRLWWAAYERGLLLSPANLVSLSSPMTAADVTEITERLADAVLSVAASAS